MGRILVGWKGFRNNLENLCHPICNRLYLECLKVLMRWDVLRNIFFYLEFLRQGARLCGAFVFVCDCMHVVCVSMAVRCIRACVCVCTQKCHPPASCHLLQLNPQMFLFSLDSCSSCSPRSFSSLFSSTEVRRWNLTSVRSKHQAVKDWSTWFCESLYVLLKEANVLSIVHGPSGIT